MKCGEILHIRKNKEPICKKCKRNRTKLELGDKMGRTSIEYFFTAWINETDFPFIIDKLSQATNDSINSILLERKREIGKLNARVGIKSILQYFTNIDNLIIRLKEIYASDINQY